MQKGCTLAALVAAFALCACVHTDVHRIGRQHLTGGAEGSVPTYRALPLGYEQVAMLNVEADGLATRERLERHILRRASLLGCDGVMRVRFLANEVQGICIKRRESIQRAEPMLLTVLEPSQELIDEVKNSGVESRALLRVLRQAREVAPEERAWPLRWYLEQYPESPFADKVASLFVYGSPAEVLGDAASVRMAPQAP